MKESDKHQTWIKKIRSASSWSSAMGLLLWLLVIPLFLLAINREQYLWLLGCPVLMLAGIWFFKVSAGFESVASNLIAEHQKDTTKKG